MKDIIFSLNLGLNSSVTLVTVYISKKSLSILTKLSLRFLTLHCLIFSSCLYQVNTLSVVFLKICLLVSLHSDCLYIYRFAS